MRALLYIIPIMLLSTVICYGATDVWVQDTVRVVDTTPKSWWDHITSGSGLTFLTLVLAGATGYYAWQTRRHVDVSRDLLASNRELIELNTAQNDIAKAQLLSRIHAINRSLKGSVEITIFDQDIRSTICAFLNRSTIELLGEDYSKRVKVKLKDRSGQLYKELFGSRRINRGEETDIPLIVWEELHDTDKADFEFLGYVDTEQSSEQDNTA